MFSLTHGLNAPGETVTHGLNSGVVAAVAPIIGVSSYEGQVLGGVYSGNVIGEYTGGVIGGYEGKIKKE